MDMWALIIIGAGIVLWFLSKKKPAFLFVTGVGVGLMWGALWANAIVQRVLR